MMNKPVEDNRILVMADDDADDRLLFGEAAGECEPAVKVQFVKDGVELLSYLLRLGAYSDESPGRRIVVVLDLNMPRMAGHEVLTKMKTSASLRHIPVVVLSTSRQEKDIRRAYALGASSYITKPRNYEELIDVVQSIKHYWMETVSLPSGDMEGNSHHE